MKKWSFGKTVKVNCVICNTQFEDFKSNKRKYCSYECYHKSLKGKPGKKNRIKKTCTYCGKEFERPAGNFGKKIKNYFCCHKCSSDWYSIHGVRGEEHPSWRGGYSNPAYRGEWEKIKTKVRIRAKGKCEKCGNTHNLMDVHHCIPVRLKVDSKITNCLENLLYLCRPCHIEEERSLRGRYSHQKKV